jgi:hypothetical protein
MKRYIKSSVTNLELSYDQEKQVKDGLYSIVMKYFHDGSHSITRSMSLSRHTYDILPYTSRPQSGYYNTSANPSMDKDPQSLNAFRAEVRKFLKQYGVTRVKFDTSSGKVHWGYISGPDDFPVTYLNAIYFG